MIYYIIPLQQILKYNVKKMNFHRYSTMRGSGSLAWLLLYHTWLLAFGIPGGVQTAVPFPIRSGLGMSVMEGLNDTMSNSEVDSTNDSANATMSCDDARMRCAYRTGCGRALQHYITRCASVLQGDVRDCPEMCQHALVALMSTDEGKELMTVSIVLFFFFF